MEKTSELELRRYQVLHGSHTDDMGRSYHRGEYVITRKALDATFVNKFVEDRAPITASERAEHAKASEAAQKRAVEAQQKVKREEMEAAAYLAAARDGGDEPAPEASKRRRTK